QHVVGGTRRRRGRAYRGGPGQERANQRDEDGSARGHGRPYRRGAFLGAAAMAALRRALRAFSRRFRRRLSSRILSIIESLLGEGRGLYRVFCGVVGGKLYAITVSFPAPVRAASNARPLCASAA